MSLDAFPSPRDSTENIDFETFTAVRRVVDELMSYPAGIPLERLAQFLEHDYSNWHDILLLILATDYVDIHEGIVRIDSRL